MFGWVYKRNGIYGKPDKNRDPVLHLLYHMPINNLNFDVLKDTYAAASVLRNTHTPDGKLIAKETVSIDVDDPSARLSNAALFLSVLIYPDCMAKRQKFVEYMAAALVKRHVARTSPERRGFISVTSIPNKKIEQFLYGEKKSARYAFNMRMRAAAAIFNKLTSSETPSEQISLKDAVEPIARYNSSQTPGFYSANGDELDSFIKRILWPSKPVIHLAMALYSQLSKVGINNPTLVYLVENPDLWLNEVIKIGEVFRINHHLLFPSYETDYLKSRNKNFIINYEDTIAFVQILSNLQR